MTTPLETPVVLVTGGTRNIGRQIAIDFAAAGYGVAILARDEAALDAVCKEIEDAGGTAAGFVADVADSGGVAFAVRSAMETFGHIDVLINNAAHRDHAPFVELSLDAFVRAIEVNV